MLAHLTLDAIPHVLRMDVRLLSPDCRIDVDPERCWDALAVVLENTARHYPR